MTAALPIEASDTPAVLHKTLVELAARCARDPLAFVRAAFPWGRDTLADHAGPDDWQIDVLTAVRDGLLTPEQAIRIAVASGHGVGKSALVAWVILWSMTTCVDCRGIATANTAAQLAQKTWPELAKWHRISLWRDWFVVTATALHSADPIHEKTWRFDATPWSEQNVEAFAGLHNQGKRVLVLFDEASSIPTPIWETVEGALTDRDTELLFLAFGNPTRNTGRFRECFGRLSHRWVTRQVDSRQVKITNKTQIAAWIADNGEDSDFVRIRVRGVFPRAGSLEFIGSDLVEEARKREVEVSPFDPLIMGVDVARFGDDRSVIAFRRGRDARSIRQIVLRGVDTMTLAGRVSQEYARHQADALFVDGGGVGGGVVDRLRQLGVQLIEVQFGGSPSQVSVNDEFHVYANKRAEMWGNMRAWLEGGAIEDNEELAADLIGPQYGYVLRQGRDAIQLERKEDMKVRGLSSSDRADALALTFAQVVMPRRFPDFGQRRTSYKLPDYDPFAAEYARADGALGR